MPTFILKFDSKLMQITFKTFIVDFSKSYLFIAAIRN